MGKFWDKKENERDDGWAVPSKQKIVLSQFISFALNRTLNWFHIETSMKFKEKKENEWAQPPEHSD